MSRFHWTFKHKREASMTRYWYSRVKVEMRKRHKTTSITTTQFTKTTRF